MLSKMKPFFPIILAFLLAATNADPFLGIWKLNFQKSKLPGKDVQSQIFSIVIVPEGQLNLIESMGVNGKTASMQYITNLDGRDAPVLGMPGTPTVAVKMTGIRSREAVWKNDGKVFQKTNSTISKDGKTWTIELQSFNPQGQPAGGPRVFIYERQASNVVAHGSSH